MICPATPTPQNDPLAYYIRAFCLGNEVPHIASLLQGLKTRDVHLTLAGEPPPPPTDMPDWDRAALVYKKGKSPLIVECHRNDAEGSPARRQIESFLKQIGPPGKSTIKRRITAHLQGTKFIIACNLPVDDMDDDGWDANGQILTFFVENCHALIQADREGFYERANLILPLP
jgi:hypothetical protein